MPSVTVLLFGPLRESAGWSERRASADSVDDLWSTLCRECPRLQRHREGVRPAVDLAYTSWGQALSEGATVAFLPPVAGGSA